jgi:putative ABC transport system ATP-binding protein
MLFELNAGTSTTLVLVTHDLEIAQRAGRIIRLKGGVMVDEK